MMPRDIREGEYREHEVKSESAVPIEMTPVDEDITLQVLLEVFRSILKRRNRKHFKAIARYGLCSLQRRMEYKEWLSSRKRESSLTVSSLRAHDWDMHCREIASLRRAYLTDYVQFQFWQANRIHTPAVWPVISRKRTAPEAVGHVDAESAPMKSFRY